MTARARALEQRGAAIISAACPCRTGGPTHVLLRLVEPAMRHEAWSHPGPGCSGSLAGRQKSRTDAAWSAPDAALAAARRMGAGSTGRARRTQPSQT